MSTVTPKLELDPKVMNRAKKAWAKRNGLSPTLTPEEIHFSKTIETAIDEYLPQILECLENAGLRKQENLEKNRPRRIGRELWERLEKCTEKYDVSRVGLVRAALTLMSMELDGPSASRKKKSKKKSTRSKK